VNKAQEFVGTAARFDESVTIHEPCFIGENVSLKNCVIGPHTSIGNNSSIENCTITNSIVQEQCSLNQFNCHDSLIGNHVVVKGSGAATQVFSLGDFSSIG
jgi:glucose-1-phosphate thymidylyltransferase